MGRALEQTTTSTRVIIASLKLRERGKTLPYSYASRWTSHNADGNWNRNNDQLINMGGYNILIAL